MSCALIFDERTISGKFLWNDKTIFDLIFNSHLVRAEGNNAVAVFSETKQITADLFISSPPISLTDLEVFFFY